MEERTTIQIEKATRLNLKKIALQMGDKTMDQAIKELIKLYEDRKSN
jgi:uncharacterized protein YegL